MSESKKVAKVHEFVLTCCGIAYLLTATYQYYAVKWCMLMCEDRRKETVMIAIALVVLTIPISLFHSFSHWRYFTKPHMQSQVIRIIWMVPVFSLESLLSLFYPHNRFYFRVVREVYEAYVLYCFSLLMANYLGDEQQLNRFLREKFPATAIKHTMPFCCFTPWKLNEDFLGSCRVGVIQHVIFRLALAIVTVCNYNGSLYRVGDYSPSKPFLWIVMLNGSSQWYALYVLYLFYHVTKRKLAPIQSLVKFIGIKVVMFFSWWQSLLISALVSYGFIRRSRQLVAEEVGLQFETMLVLMEMLLAACFFLYCFPVSDFSGTKVTPVESIEAPRSRSSAPVDVQTSVLLLGIIPVRVNGNLARNCVWFYKCIMCVPSYVRNFDFDLTAMGGRGGKNDCGSDDEGAGDSGVEAPEATVSVRPRRQSLMSPGDAVYEGDGYIADRDIELADGVVSAHLQDVDEWPNVEGVDAFNCSYSSDGGAKTSELDLAPTRNSFRGSHRYCDGGNGADTAPESAPSSSHSRSNSDGNSGSLFYDYSYALLSFIDNGGVPEKPSPPMKSREQALPTTINSNNYNNNNNNIHTNTICSPPSPGGATLSLSPEQEDLPEYLLDDSFLGDLNMSVSQTQSGEMGGITNGWRQEQEFSSKSKYVYAHASPTFSRPPSLVLPNEDASGTIPLLDSSSTGNRETAQGQGLQPTSSGETPNAGSTDGRVDIESGEAPRTPEKPAEEVPSVWKAIYLSTVPLELGKDIKNLGSNVIKKAAASPTAYFRRNVRQLVNPAVSPTATGPAVDYS